MTENTEAPIQYSTKVGDDILLLRANDGEDFKARTEDMLKVLDETADSWTEIKQLLLGKAVVTTGTATGVVGQPDTAPVLSSPPPGASGVPNCPHGVRQVKSGNSARGPWTAQFCPAPKGDPTACAPIWM